MNDPQKCYCADPGVIPPCSYCVGDVDALPPIVQKARDFAIAAHGDLGGLR